MRLGIGSWSFPWAIGVPGYPQPATPLDAVGLLEKAKSLDVDLVQICDNYPLHARSADELDQIARTAQELGISVEVGTRGVEPSHLLRYLEIATRLRATSVRTIVDNSADPYRVWIAQVLPRYAEAGVTIALETNEGLSVDAFAALVEALDSPYLGITLDTVNSLGREERTQDVVAKLARYAIVVHYKDYAIERVDHRMGFLVVGRPAGEGRVDAHWLFDSLAQAGRDPQVIVELWPPFLGSVEATIAQEERWVGKSVRFLQRLLD
jgi:sugar phosphate isomerase/epimerase